MFLLDIRMHWRILLLLWFINSARKSRRGSMITDKSINWLVFIFQHLPQKNQHSSPSTHFKNQIWSLFLYAAYKKAHKAFLLQVQTGKLYFQMKSKHTFSISALSKVNFINQKRMQPVLQSLLPPKIMLKARPACLLIMYELLNPSKPISSEVIASTFSAISHPCTPVSWEQMYNYLLDQ